MPPFHYLLQDRLDQVRRFLTKGTQTIVRLTPTIVRTTRRVVRLTQTIVWTTLTRGRLGLQSPGDRPEKFISQRLHMASAQHREPREMGALPQEKKLSQLYRKPLES
jgi:hypothetical protein